MRPIQVHPQSEKGAAILMALFLTLLVALLIPPVLQRAVFQYNNAFRENRFITALHGAEAGVDEGLWHLSFDKQKTWEGWNISNSASYSKPKKPIYDADGNSIGEYEVTIANPLALGTSINLGVGGTTPFPITSNSAPLITSIAGVPDITSQGSEIRLVQVNAKARTTFSLGLFSDKDLTIGGTTLVNSYNSSLGPYNTATNAFDNGDAGTNGNLVLNGTPIIDGDASAGGSVVLKGNNAEITGEVEGGMTKIDLPPVDSYVAAAKAVNDNASIPKAIKPNGQLVDVYNAGNQSLSIQAGATLNLPGGVDKAHPKVYYLSSASLTGNSTINITGYVVIFTDGNLDFAGGTVVNNAGAGPPEKLLVYSSGSASTNIKINGGAGFAGAVYAPKAQIAYSGGGNIFGAAVGGSVSLSGNAQFHYDEALGQTGLAVYFEVENWVEKASPS
jgi:hypothetical protein